MQMLICHVWMSNAYACAGARHLSVCDYVCSCLCGILSAVLFFFVPSCAGCRQKIKAAVRRLLFSFTVQ